MSSFRSFFSALLHRIACFWLVIKSLFTRSKKPHPDHEAGPADELDVEGKEPLEFSLEEFAAAHALARSNDPFLTHEKPATPTIRPPPVRRQLAVLQAIRRDGSLPYDDNAEIRRNGIYFGPPVDVGGLDALPFYNVQDFLDESYSVESSPSPQSVDLTEQHSHRDSIATDASMSRPSESEDSASLYEDVTDEFVPYGPIREPPTSTALPDWRQADESFWKTEVALGLNKFKESNPEHDDISSIHSDRRSETKRRSQSSQIRDIQEWRNDLGQQQPRVITPPPRAPDYKLAQTFQFPRSRSSVP